MVDLFCGLGGWGSGGLAEGYDVVGFDIEQHVYGAHRYPAQLVVQDVLTLHGSQFRTADLIVASPPCQEYSYMAMPWSIAKAKAAAIRADESGQALVDLTRLFDACFRIQREASETAGRHIPLIVENVRGAQPWVGRARWSYGSFYLWGDVPALMPIVRRAVKVPGMRFDVAHNTTSVKGRNPDGRKAKCDCQHPETTPDGFAAISEGCPIHGDLGPTLSTTFETVRSGGSDPMWQRGFQQTAADHIKVGNGWFGVGNDRSPMHQHSSKSPARKMASAMIAKIPEPLSRYIARTFHPNNSSITS